MRIVEEFLWGVVVSTVSPAKLYAEDELKIRQKALRSHEITLIHFFIALIHPIQWTIAYPVGADRPAKRQKKTSCVSTG